ncbi:hypothetical protein [Acrocarpospora sp. B8E8]|uniref:hypothetical protein n=1 Tax=Acrocarpospora sp. B8E8 TaxID=3153572 RepID=UPI00325FD660
MAIRDGQAVRVEVRLVWPEDDIPTAEEAAAMRAELARLRQRLDDMNQDAMEEKTREH